MSLGNEQQFGNNLVWFRLFIVWFRPVGIWWCHHTLVGINVLIQFIDDMWLWIWNSDISVGKISGADFSFLVELSLPLRTHLQIRSWICKWLLGYADKAMNMLMRFVGRLLYEPIQRWAACKIGLRFEYLGL